jgi:hypothetical protein
MAINKFFPPIPQNKIEECFVWRDWFQRLSDKVFGTLATQDSNSVAITGGTISGTTITDILLNGDTITNSTIDSSPIGTRSASTGNFTTLGTNYIDFLTSGSFTRQSARVGWNAVDETLDIGMPYGVVQQTGLETFARVQNNTGITIPNGTVVGFSGVSVDNTLLCSPYLANGSTPSLYVLGIMTHDFPDSGSKGYCSTFGYVRDVNTSGYVVGDVLYASPTVAGGLTKVKPTSPYNVVPMAAVLKVGTTDGVVFVRPTIEQQTYFGGFSKTDTTSPAVIDTAYALVLNNTDVATGVALGTPASRLVISNAGLYHISLSMQITSTSASAKTVRMWLRKNGTTSLANSTRLASIALNNGSVVIATSDVYTFLANDYVEVMYASDSTAVSIATVAATAYSPAAPALIVAITQTAQ